MRNDLAAELAESVTDGEHFYTLSYYPSNKKYDGEYRRIRVEMRNPELVVRSGEGYLASAPTRPTGDAAAQTMLSL